MTQVNLLPISAHQQDNRELLANFINYNRNRLLNHIQRRMTQGLASKIEAKDILQEMTVAALSAIDNRDCNQPISYHWLCNLAERRIIDAHRKFFVAKKRSMVYEIPINHPITDCGSLAFIDVIDAMVTTPSQFLRHHQNIDIFYETIGNLPNAQYEALRLRYVEGCLINQISEILGKSEGAVRVMLSRAIKKIQTALIESNEY